MTCVICRHGDTKDGHATVTLQRGETIVIIKDVLAETEENDDEHRARHERERPNDAEDDIRRQDGLTRGS